MAAGQAALAGHDVTVIEKNSRPARKLMITGKGRCNITNACDVGDLIANVPRNGKFLYSAFVGFNSYDTISFFEGQGLKLKTERGNRVFPASDKASDVVDTLVGFAKKSGAKIICETAERLIIGENGVTGLELKDGKGLDADAVILATGGKSYPLTGSTGDGYRMAAEAGHTVIPQMPSLVPLTELGGKCAKMQGLSLKNASITVVDNDSGKAVYKDFGELLFTHFGMSGPLILSASAHMRDMKSGKYRVIIDLKPALSEEQLDVRIQRDFLEFSNRDFINALGKLLPQSMIPVAAEETGIPFGVKVNNITKEQRRILVSVLKSFSIDINGFRPIDEAIITSGGVSVGEINPKTMESKLVKGLYFAGEVIDVDAYTGGFNLQIAFSTGYAAGINVNKRNEGQQ